jgi:hypothetical protein
MFSVKCGVGNSTRGGTLPPTIMCHEHRTGSPRALLDSSGRRDISGLGSADRELLLVGWAATPADGSHCEIPDLGAKSDHRLERERAAQAALGQIQQE